MLAVFHSTREVLVSLFCSDTYKQLFLPVHMLGWVVGVEMLQVRVAFCQIDYPGPTFCPWQRDIASGCLLTSCQPAFRSFWSQIQWTMNLRVVQIKSHFHGNSGLHMSKVLSLFILQIYSQIFLQIFFSSYCPSILLLLSSFVLLTCLPSLINS